MKVSASIGTNQSLFESSHSEYSGTNSSNERFLKVLVQDTGVGIPTDLLKKIFKLGRTNYRFM